MLIRYEPEGKTEDAILGVGRVIAQLFSRNLKRVATPRSGRSSCACPSETTPKGVYLFSNFISMRTAHETIRCNSGVVRCRIRYLHSELSPGAGYVREATHTEEAVAHFSPKNRTPADNVVANKPNTHHQPTARTTPPAPRQWTEASHSQASQVQQHKDSSSVTVLRSCG